MSDYVHNKVVRLPFPKEIITKCNVKNGYYCQPYLKELLGDLWNNRNKNSFQLECTDKEYYIDWLYYSTYGEESGDWGNVRNLTNKELNTIKPYFNKLGIDYSDEDLRVVDYCYYNGCEAPDYYNLNADDSDLFISKT